MLKLLLPEDLSVSSVAEEEGISAPTLYAWRQQASKRGKPEPGCGKQTDDWSGQAKLAVLVETAGLNESELSECCREKGLSPIRSRLK
jgi:transposase-like protein